MVKKFTRLGLIVASIFIAGLVSSNDETVTSAIVNSGAAAATIHDTDDYLLFTTVPAIAGAINRAPPPPPPIVNPRWSVVTEVCCPTSSATFRVNQGSDSRSSTAPSCSVAASQSSEVESTAGSKGFSFSIDSAGCGRLADSFSFAFQEKTRYLFAAQFENGGVNINVFSGAINQTASASKNDSDSDQSLSYERTIRLSNMIEGKSSFESIADDLKRSGNRDVK